MTKRIVIADDTAYMRAIIKEAATSLGIMVAGEAEDGLEALTVYQQQQPDLIVLNVVMPKMNGIETLKCIRTWDPHANVMICTAMGQAPKVFAAVKAGANHFITKPIDNKRLIEALGKALDINIDQPKVKRH